MDIKKKIYKERGNEYGQLLAPLSGCLLSLMLAIGTLPARGEQAGDSADLTHLGVEDLMNLQVISTAKQAQRLSDAAAAVFVITQDDMRRAGVTSVPEALRLAPGMQVARIDSNKWAISARGFNGRFANKLLVLVDGRSVYTPSFSGVYWEVQDLLLEDIDRIEVIRGPGATLWGANAVNGVINIITKHPVDTQGGLVSLTAGKEEKAIAGLRYGGRLGDTGHYRVYGKYLKRDGLVGMDEKDARDDWHLGSGGFRLDWAPSSANAFTAQGDWYRGDLDQNLEVPTFTPPFSRLARDTAEASGGNLQGRWQHTLSPTSQLSLQLYYQQENRKEIIQKAKIETFDIDMQHAFALGERHEIVWGVGFRATSDEFKDAELSTVSPKRRRYDLFNAFIQDRINLLPDQLELTLGTKLEHNDFTGWEVQPSARLLWTPTPRQRLWAAVSRAVRTPSRGERDGNFTLFTVPPNPLSPLPVSLSYQGNPDFGSEKLIAYELGYRIWPTDKLSLDVAAFYNDYEDLRGVRQVPPVMSVARGIPVLRAPLIVVNAQEGSTYGLELSADWRPVDRWRLRFAYSYLRTNQKFFSEGEGEGEDRNLDTPRHQAYLHSAFDLRDDLELDLWLRYVDGFESSNILGQFQGRPLKVDDYLTLDLRLGWKPYRDLELSLVGTNLLDSPHLEFVQEVQAFPTQVERSLYGQLRWSF